MAAVASAGRFTAERQSAKLHVLFRLLRGPARQLCRDDRAERRPAQAGAPDDHGRAVRRRRVADAVPPPTGPACKAQVDLPNDDDLANWSHHASVATTGDEVLKSAMAGSALVSFVFGMEVTADLVRAHAAS